ncbi:MAG TPA: hypothetical protein VEW93_06615 [Acidimicrobiales bacterium]|nr:hypothetical protein [Acidimicrobiales bacterium]
MPGPTLLADVVDTSAAVAATSGRSAKRDALAALLGRLAPDEVVPVVGFLVGEPRQGRIGIGWRTLASAAVPPAGVATLAVAEVDRALDELAGLGGPGSAAQRRALLSGLLGRATAEEARFLTLLLGGELRQGALAGVMADAVARAAEIPAPVVRRAAMLGGDLGLIARIALTDGSEGLAGIGLVVGRPLQPMLASTAATVTEAVEAMDQAVVDWKLDGIRIQAHRQGDDVLVVTRNLNDITARVPEVVEVVRGLPAGQLVLDGEVLLVDPAGRPVPFQDTASTVSRDVPAGDPGGAGGTADQATGGGDGRDGAPAAAAENHPRAGPETATGGPGQEGAVAGGAAARPWFFDLLHRDGIDLVDAPLLERRRLLVEVAEAWTVPHVVTDDPVAGAQVLDDALAAGHEGVVVKAATSPYEAGRRGKAWRKVKPVHTLDLVVLAAEWGSGRRVGWLSNLHLGARADTGDDGQPGPGDPDRGDGLVMVGKTFKGLTDELLAWQTEALLARAVREESWGGPRTGVVHVRPELVVEIALDGVQRSTRYAGGVALRFARVVRYRPDKDAADADTITTVRAFTAGS